MPRKAKEINYFYAVEYWKPKYAPFQQIISQVIQSANTKVVHVCTTTQVGKSFLAYNDLLHTITRGWNKLPNSEEGKNRMKDKLFFVVGTTDNELKRFFGEQLLKPFGKDKDGNLPVSIDSIKITIMQEDGKEIFIPLVRKFNINTGVPTIEFFNNCKLFFFAENANPEKHLPGYTFKKGLYDEFAKFNGDITHMVSDRLMHEKGTLLTVTTLNEDDPHNWYTQNILNHYKKNGKLITEQKQGQLCGLDIYKIEIDEKVEVERFNDKGELEKQFVSNKENSFLIIGDLEKIYPYAHNGEEIYLQIRNDVSRGTKTEDAYQAIHRCNPNINHNLRILSNYNAERNLLDITGKKRELEMLFPYQAIGFDPGKADGTKHSSNVGWARIGMRLDPQNPKFEQFCILDSGILNMQDALLDNLVPFLLNFNLPIYTDNSLFKVTSRTSTRVNRPVDDYLAIAKELGRYKEAHTLFKPAGGTNLRNDSSQRVAWWQIALSAFSNPEEKKNYLSQKRLPFSIEDYVQYFKPFTEDAGSQIQIAISNEEITLNERLIKEIENWKKTKDKDGKIKEMGSSKTKIDCWDAASLGVDGLIVHKKYIENKRPIIQKPTINLYRQHFLTLDDIMK